MEDLTQLCGRCKDAKPQEEYYPSQWGKDASGAWCIQCYQEWHRERYTPKSGADDAPRNCAQCGSIYRPKQRRVSIYCSPECKTKARNARVSAEVLAAKTERVCLYCAGIIPQSARKDAVFCSEQCNYKAHALQRKLRARTGSDDKPGYLRAEICIRDGWLCGICRRPVDKSLEYPDLLCASLDHIVPVSRGGSNDPANLRVVHLVCNLRRGNTPVEEIESGVLPDTCYRSTPFIDLDPAIPTSERPCTRCENAPREIGSYCRPCRREMQVTYGREFHKRGVYRKSQDPCARCHKNPRQGNRPYCQDCISLNNRESRARRKARTATA